MRDIRDDQQTTSPADGFIGQSSGHVVLGELRRVKADLTLPVLELLPDGSYSSVLICREHAKNVKRWRDGQMALRWCAAGMVEAGKQVRRVNGHMHLATLRAALERETNENVGATCQDEEVNAA